MQITKRDGTKQTLDLNKIHAVLTWACEGHNDDALSPIKGVSVSQIEINAQLHFYDGMPTSKIHDTLIKAASELISEDYPNYDHVAARLVWFSVRKEAFRNNLPPTLLSVVRKNVASGVYTKDILDLYTEEEINEINGLIDHRRDDLFKYAGAEQMRKKYLAQNRKTKQIYESFQFPYILVAALLFAKYPKATRLKYIKRYYDLTSQHFISLPTPIMAGLRTNVKQFSSCFPAGQKVWTDNGIKNIEDVNKGDKVLSDDGKYHQVLETREKYYEDNVFVKISSSFPIKDDFMSTSNHRIKALSSSGERWNRQFKDIAWIEAKDLKIGDLIHIPFSKEVNGELSLNLMDYLTNNSETDKLYALDSDGFIVKLSKDKTRKKTIVDSKVTKIKNSITMNKSIARLLGYFLAEGHLNKNNSFNFTFSSQETDWHNDIVNIMKTEFDLPATISSRKDNSTTITFYSKVIKDFISYMVGNGFDKKFLNQYLMELPYDIQKELLIGVIRGDGCINRNGMVLGLANENLIRQLAMISLRNGLYPSLSVTLKENIQKYKEDKSYKRTSTGAEIKYISRHDIFNLHLAIGGNVNFLLETNKNLYKLDINRRNMPRYSRYINGEYYSNILNLENVVKEDELVYDLQVEGSESFSVAGISVHNCTLIESGDSLNSINAAAASIVDYASRKAGIGMSIGGIRAEGQTVRNGDAVTTGVLPFAKYFNAALKSCSQGAVRGASATFNYPVWHLEFERLIELKNNKGTDETRLRTVDYCVHLNRLFYERVSLKQNITFFSPEEVPDLYKAFYSSDYKLFEKLYKQYEKDETKTKKTLPAVDVFTKILQERFETGRIYIFNADHVNEHGSFYEPIKMTNLCTEITLPTTPMGNDDSLIALCTLSAINFGKFTPFGELDQESSAPARQEQKLRDACEMAVRGLDALLDYQDYPLEAAKRHSMRYRPLGVGIIGFAHWLAKGKLYWGEKNTLVEVETMMEKMAYYLTEASINLAEEFGPITTKTKYHDGIFPIDTAYIKAKTQMDWDILRARVKKYGIRNATLMALMPSETSSQLANETNGIEPPRDMVSIKGSKEGVLPQVVPEFHKLGGYYQTLWQIDAKDYLKTIAILQKYIDQAISVNTSYDSTKKEITMSRLLEDLMYSYKLGHKTLYYCNTLDGSGEAKEEEDDCDSGACKI